MSRSVIPSVKGFQGFQGIVGAQGLGGLLGVTVKNSNYSVSASDVVLLGDASSAGFQFTLPAATGVQGREFTFKKTDVTLNVITVKPVGATLDSGTSYLLEFQNEFVSIISDGANWYITSE